MIHVIGTGLSGMSMAAALAHHGFEVTLIGPKPEAAPDDRTTAILQPNIDFLDRLGLWTPLAATATPLIRMELHDQAHVSFFESSEMDLDQFGFNILNTQLKEALQARMTKQSAIHWQQTNVETMTRSTKGWTLHLANKKTLQAQLVIAADGRSSKTREAAGIACDEKPEQQAALVTMLECEKPHHYTSAEWYRKGGPFTLVPCRNKQLALVWCDQEKIIDAQLKADTDALSTTLTDMTEQRFGTLRVTGARQKWPIRPMKARTLVAPHLTLIGEAAHVLPPIGAQGFNTSLLDIRELLDHLLKGQKLGLAVSDPALLNAYAQQRASDIGLRYHGITRLNDLIRAQHPASAFARRIALNALDRVTPLRRQIMRFAMGSGR